MFLLKLWGLAPIQCADWKIRYVENVCVRLSRQRPSVFSRGMIYYMIESEVRQWLWQLGGSVTNVLFCILQAPTRSPSAAQPLEASARTARFSIWVSWTRIVLLRMSVELTYSIRGHSTGPWAASICRWFIIYGVFLAAVAIIQDLLAYNKLVTSTSFFSFPRRTWRGQIG